MDKMTENVEAERTRLIELIKHLELKMSAIDQHTADEQWQLRQRQATLDTERNVFEREKSCVREKLEDDEKRLQVSHRDKRTLVYRKKLIYIYSGVAQELKEKHFAEHKRLMDMIDAERQSVQSERMKLETMAMLHQQQNTKRQDNRFEIDAAVKVAQDMTRQTNDERDKLLDMQRQCEMERQQLLNMKYTIRSKEVDLEQSVKEAKLQIVCWLLVH